MWTDERKKQVIDIIMSGGSARDAADKLLVTRNSILGMLNRSGIKIRKMRSNQPPPKPIRIIKANGINIKWAEPAYNEKESSEKAPLDNRKRHPIINGNCAVPITHISSHRCHYPLWHGNTPFKEKKYCGAPTERYPYCEAHRAICFDLVRKPDASRVRPFRRASK